METVLTETEEDIKTNNYNAGGGVPGIASAEFGNTNSSNLSTAFAKSNFESQELAFHDFALDVLLDKINQMKENIPSSFIHVDGKLRLYNFERLEAITQSDLIDIFDEDKLHNKNINNQIEQLKKLKQNINKTQINKEIANLKSQLKDVDKSKLKDFEHVRNFGKIGNALYPNSCLVKLKNILLICPKENFRLNEASISLFNESDKTAKCLALYIYTRNNGYIQKNADGSIVQLSVETIAASAPTMMMDLILDNFGLSKKGDVIARPIAIYYE